MNHHRRSDFILSFRIHTSACSSWKNARSTRQRTVSVGTADLGNPCASSMSVFLFAGCFALFIGFRLLLSGARKPLWLPVADSVISLGAGLILVVTSDEQHRLFWFSLILISVGSVAASLSEEAQGQEEQA